MPGLLYPVVAIIIIKLMVITVLVINFLGTKQFETSKEFRNEGLKKTNSEITKGRRVTINPLERKF